MDISVDDLRAIAPRARSGLVGPLADAMTEVLGRYGIDTPLRVAHFVAQAAHESAGFTTLEELGNRAYFAKYDAGTSIGKRLGNTERGDGYTFRGRGIFQCTGRANYGVYGKKLRRDLISDPELAADPKISVLIACEYWKAKGLNAWADRDDVKEITRRINGGYNGLADRKALLARAKKVFGATGNAVTPLFDEGSAEIPDAPIAAEAPKSWLKSKIVWASGAIGTMGASDVYEKAQDFAYRFTDDPAGHAISFVRAYPGLCLATALAAYIVYERVMLLRRGC